jgi:rhodanese-related sulfurtransferase
MLKTKLQSLFLAFIITGCSAAESLSPGKAHTMIKNNAFSGIIDIREPKKFIDSRIAGAVNIEYHPSVFLKEMKSFDKNMPLLVYCGTGLKTETAAEKLISSGYKKIYIIAGGLNAWEKAGYPVLK